MRFIGKCRRMVQRVRIKLTFKRVVRHMHVFVTHFRNRRRVRFQAEVIICIDNFERMNKVVRAQKVIISKIILIQRNWRKFMSKKFFTMYLNMIKWHKQELYLYSRMKSPYFFQDFSFKPLIKGLTTQDKIFVMGLIDTVKTEYSRLDRKKIPIYELVPLNVKQFYIIEYFTVYRKGSEVRRSFTVIQDKMLHLLIADCLSQRVYWTQIAKNRYFRSPVIARIKHEFQSIPKPKPVEEKKLTFERR